MEKIKQLFVVGGSAAASLPETQLRAFNDLFSRQCLNSAGIATGTTTSKWKIANSIFVLIGGVPVLVTTADGPAVTGYNLTSSQVGGFVITVDASGTQYGLPIQPAAALGGIQFPVVPPSQAAVGLVLINTSSAATFTGGTTLMSAGSVQLLNIVGPFNPLNAF